MKTLKKIIISISCALFVFIFASCMSTSSAQPKGHYNTKNLRNNARFEVKVADGVWWVPANSLGKTRYSDEEIAEMVNLSPEEKQAMISNLYEAIQLYQISGFYSADTGYWIDNTKTRIGWEVKIDAYTAVRINAGGCADSSSWLRYILDGDYDEVGYLHMNENECGGHVISYIKQDGFYYFIDMTHFRSEWLECGKETGNLESYYDCDYILGNIHKATSPEAYVDYFVQIQEEVKKHADSRGDEYKPNVWYWIYSEMDPIWVGETRRNWDRHELILPSEKESIVKTVYYDGSKGFHYRFATDPVGIEFSITEEEWPTPVIEPIKVW